MNPKDLIEKCARIQKKLATPPKAMNPKEIIERRLTWAENLLNRAEVFDYPSDVPSRSDLETWVKRRKDKLSWFKLGEEFYPDCEPETAKSNARTACRHVEHFFTRKAIIMRMAKKEGHKRNPDGLVVALSRLRTQPEKKVEKELRDSLRQRVIPAEATPEALGPSSKCRSDAK